MRAGRFLAWLLAAVATVGCEIALAQPPEGAPGESETVRAPAAWAGPWVRQPLPTVGLAPLPVSEIDAAEPQATPPPGRPIAPAALTLEDLIQIALQGNPTLVQARMAVQAAQGDYLQAGLYPNPQAYYVGDEIGNDGTEGLQGGGLVQEFVTAGKLRLGRAVASHGVQQARCSWEAQQLRVLNDVRANYYDVLLAQMMIEVNERLVQIGQAGVKTTQQLREAMEVSRTDVLQALIEAERADLSLAQARFFHQAAWQRLTAVLGRPEMAPVRLVGEVETGLPELNWEDTLTRLLAQSPELARTRAGVERARCDLALQCARRIPNVEVAAGPKYDTGSYYGVLDVAVTVPIPLFDRNQGNIVRARAGLTAALNEVQRVELDLRNRYAAAFQPYANARYQVEAYAKTILPNAKESLDLTQTGYREGEFAYLTLLTAQRTYFTVNLDYLASLREMWRQAIQLEGLLLSGGLDAAW